MKQNLRMISSLSAILIALGAVVMFDRFAWTSALSAVFTALAGILLLTIWRLIWADPARAARKERLRDQRLRLIVENIADYGVFMLGVDGEVVSWNLGAERIKGYSSGEIIGRHFSVFYTEEDRHLGKPARELEIAGATGRFEEEGWRMRKDGTRFWANVVINAVRDEQGELLGFAKIARDLTERKLREDYARHVAQHDFLTGLPNRALLQDRMLSAIQRARRERSRAAIMMIDLDHFKRVNDSLGHHVGDQLLKTVSERILACVRSMDTVARMGGDEFALVLSDVQDDAGLECLAAKLVERISAPTQLGGHELLVTPSIGISRYPEDGEDPQLLLMNADSAMYRAKAEGRQGYRLFSRDMEIAARNKMDLEGAMRQALKLGEFRLHYQPQVSLGDGEIIGMEALLRWNNTQLGAVSPANFIPVAEESGLILEIGEWVLAKACRDAQQLQRSTGRLLRVAVNLSPRQFRQGNLLDLVRTSLEESGLQPAQLELEITEGVLMADTEQTVERMHSLRALGVSIAVDDFGVGFSSLSYITKFPISTLKIDRTFVSQLPDSASEAAVAQVIIALARSLNISVVAEGVETAAQLDFLRARHCDAAQGYHLGRPVPLEQFSVQGFHFSEALPVETFKRDFDKLQRQGRLGVGVPG